MRRSIFTRPVVFLPVLAFIFLIWIYRTGRLEPTPYRHLGTATPVTESTVWPTKTIPVALGVYVENIYNFEPQPQTFSAEGWVWLKWPQEFQDRLDRQGITSDRLVDFVNGVQASDFVAKPGFPNPVKLPDGQYYQIYQYSGKFYANGLDFRRFPFESLRLSLNFALNPELFSSTEIPVRLVADEGQSDLGEYIDISGYITTGKNVWELIYHFESAFGLKSSGTTMQSSQVQMDVTYSRSVVSSLLQLILPLIVVMSVVLMAPNLAGSLWDVRIALPSTALLTLVFLQQAYRDKLPTLPYLTFLDQIYTLCYATALAFFCLFVWSSNRLDQAEAADRPAVIHHINQVDRRFQIVMAITLVIMITLSWFFPVR